MTIKRLSACRLAGGALVAILLLGGPSQLLWAQSAPTGKDTRQAEQADDQAAPSEGTATERAKPPREKGSAYRNQKDDLKHFEPSEEIRVDKAVDFPADI